MFTNTILSTTLTTSSSWGVFKCPTIASMTVTKWNTHTPWKVFQNLLCIQAPAHLIVSIENHASALIPLQQDVHESAGRPTLGFSSCIQRWDALQIDESDIEYMIFKEMQIRQSFRLKIQIAFEYSAWLLWKTSQSLNSRVCEVRQDSAMQDVEGFWRVANFDYGIYYVKAPRIAVWVFEWFDNSG